MNNSAPIVFFLIALLLLPGCARKYHSIGDLEFHATSSFDSSKDVYLEYTAYPFSLSSNTSYAKMAARNKIQVVKVKIKNISSQPIVIEGTHGFYQGDNRVFLLKPASTFQYTKQPTISYLLYLLLFPFRIFFFVSEDTTWMKDMLLTLNKVPLGLVTGIGLAGGNMHNSSTNNKAYYQDLMTYDIKNKHIQPGETVTGIIAYSSLKFKDLLLKEL